MLQVMGEQPDRDWKVVDVKREMLRRGWAPTPKAVEASIKRLRELGQVESAAYGFYKLPHPAEGADSATGEETA